MSSILHVSSINNGQYKTEIKPQKNSLNDEDFQAIEKSLAGNSIKRDGNIILSSDSIENVVKKLENSGNYFTEYVDPTTNVYQLTPTNFSQGKTPQLRQ
jgi:hypothetical protein